MKNLEDDGRKQKTSRFGSKPRCMLLEHAHHEPENFWRLAIVLIGNGFRIFKLGLA
jgi:hypothetical protein